MYTIFEPARQTLRGMNKLFEAAEQNIQALTPHANGCNIVSQELLTLLDVLVHKLPPFAHPVACYWEWLRKVRSVFTALETF